METCWSPDTTPIGKLPPFEIAKAYAFDQVLAHLENHTGTPVRTLLGEDEGLFISKQLALQGGGNPSRSAVFKVLQKCRQPEWFPGKVSGRRTGRPPAFSHRQKAAMAKVAMATKRRLEKPTPAVVRATLPRTCVNPTTQAPASNWTLYNIFHTLCYDEVEDDPWVYLHSPSKDFLSEEMKRSRRTCAQHIRDTFSQGSWSNHVAIDPCISILASSRAQSDEQKVAAMGVRKMMSAKSKFKGPNLRAAATVKTQGRAEDKVHWTPVFARGKVSIYVCDPTAASRDDRLPTRLNSGFEIAKFIQNVLPGILRQMQQQHGWNNTPRTVVHDKASYFVAPISQRLAAPFEGALRTAKCQSWLGDADSDCSWLAGRLGDVYPHETLISHIRRCLDHKFPRSSHGENPAQFAKRMRKVQDHLNSAAFAAPAGGGGLRSLSASLMERCKQLAELSGERLRT